MKTIKSALRKTLRLLGYEIIDSSRLADLLRLENFANSKRSSELINFNNFKNLALAYEQHIIENGNSIMPNDTRFRLLTRLQGTPPSEAYFIVQALFKCKDLPGDVCEFGVAQGETSALIANEIVLLDTKRLHLFDSFEGLPKPSEKDQLKNDIFALGSIEAYAGQMACPEELVRERLKDISFPESRCVIHKGFIEQIINEDLTLPQAVCFAYVDFDFYTPVMVALEFLHSVTPPGAIIIVDDYDFFSTGVKTAVDEFREAKNSNGIIYKCIVPNIRYGHFAILNKVAKENNKTDKIFSKIL